ncbi:MAG: prephenate dehydrogenase/arogenate dehydrogenase family protein [Oscillospiraceae bacterium]|jgi:prephenate dehydrogenase|nr:prephenate dehydrogenase/arogenate dehydrogenase family protein [Oscillospiraceae bacterium]
MAVKIAIVGMGLIGGSLGLALKQRTNYTVIGIDCDSSVIDAVMSSGAADKTGAQHLNQADLIIIAISPKATVDFLKEHAANLRPGAIVTDVCGVKRQIMKNCVPLCRDRGLYFVGGHPMAGRERGGFANADARLFEDAYYILTPPDGTPGHVLELLKQVAMQIGCAGVTVTTPEQHDKMIAFTSQLPHVLAGAYVNSPNCSGHFGFSAGSYRDVSRVATVDEALWSQLFLLNADNLCFEIDTLISNLKQYRDAVAAGNTQLISEILREGRVRKENFG